MTDATEHRVADWPTRKASFVVVCLTTPTEAQLDEIAAYVKPNIRGWEKLPRPFTRKIAGIEIEVRDV